MKNNLFCCTLLLFTLLGNSFLKAQSISEYRSQQCLNGWWDFNPVMSPEGKLFNLPVKAPVQGWLKNAMIVPGSWKKSGSELKNGTEFWSKWRVSDSFNFPEQWDSTNTAWYRRSFDIKEIKKDRAYFLRFDGVLRESWIFVNGIEVGHRKEGSLPSEHEISSAIKSGINEIVVFVTDYKRDENNRTFVHIGTDQMGAIMGIWGDVFLEERPLVRIENINIRTSTRKNELTLLYTLRNDSKKIINLNPEFTVSTKDKTYLSFSDASITLNPGETKEIIKVEPWAGYIAWSPKNPQLYFLNVSLKEKGVGIDALSERFGFREIWIEGHNFILNGSPIHMLGEWGHKDHFGFFRPEYIRQWFGMLKDLNMNYIRTHTFPHPQFVIDMADEMGILVCLESTWFMSGNQAMDKSEFWDNAKDHALDNIKYYKNHPSVILWSTGNEIRWGWNINEVIKHGPEIQKIYEDKDPTRIAFPDGSTSLWDERSQKVISRHYGVECTGEEFWDKTKPLHVGEFGKWHYGQPIDNLVWGKDNIFASFEKCATAIAEEAADIIQQARSNEVACMFPWNLSCLDNYRPSSKEIQHQWSDFTSPFAKPLRTGPYASEFAWWEPDSKGYIPGAGFTLIQHANRPFALYVREKLNQVFDDQDIAHSVSLINDFGRDITGSLKVETYIAGKKVGANERILTLKNGYALKESIKLETPKVDQKTELVINTAFYQGKTLIDSISRKVLVTPAVEKTKPWKVGNIIVYGSGNMANILKSHQIKYKYISQLDSILICNDNLLIIEKNSIKAGSTQNKTLESFINKGGKVFLMEQENSAMPELLIESKPTERCYIRAYNHPLMNRFSDDDFSYWGNDPYGKSNSDSWVVLKPYLKPTYGNTTILLDGGYGDFGSGGLLWTPLFETRSGKGILVASQLRLTEKVALYPFASKILEEILSYLYEWKPNQVTNNLAVTDLSDKRNIEKLGIKTEIINKANVIIASGKNILDNKALSKLNAKVREGATLIVHNLDSIMLVRLSNQFGLDLKPVNLGPQYNLVRESKTQLLNGISNQETYWLDKAHYTPMTNVNHKMCDWLMSSSKGISLLANESESCWREFYTMGAQSEWLRMPVVTHLLFNGPRKSASGMMLFNVGKGKIILTQVPLPDNDYAKSKIYWSQLLSNLNVPFSRSLFEGDKVTFGAQKSEGFPEKVRIIKNPGKDLIKSIVAKGDPGETSERFVNQGLIEGFKWEIVKTIGGELTLPSDCAEVMIQYELKPGRPRKLQEVVGGWPDPSQQTLLDLFGKGKVTLYVNGAEYKSINPDGEKANIPDINLNQHWNSILIHFIPESANLKMLWRNRQNVPEMEFLFD